MTTSSRVCYPVNRLAPDSHSCRLSSFPASSHYANEDAPDQGENLCISAESDQTRAQGGKSRREKKVGERERERREPFARARLFIFKPISNYRGYERTRIRSGTDGKEEPERILCVIGIHLWARMSCRSLLSLVSSSLFRASLDR